MPNNEKKGCWNCQNSYDSLPNQSTPCDNCHKYDKWKIVEEKEENEK
jgi:nitrate/TMAO reductase-like tetraheme cytochrome c subunit